jgi:hypothetical protein
MRSMIVVAALAGGIWYSAPQIETAANSRQAAVPVENQQGAPEKWRVSDAGSAGGGNCTITLEGGGASSNIGLSSGCTAATPVAQASKWWEDAEGNIVLASAQGEKIAEFTADESDGMVSVWPRHTLMTLTPAN